MASNEQSQPLKNKTTSVVLRVSIHCEGCKRKVQKLLQSLPGVDEIEIERLQQRVVVTGDVKPETLITKLVKSGKNAQLWPQKPPEVQESVVSGKEIKSPSTKTEEIPAADPSKVTTTTVPSGGDTAGKGGEKVEEDVKVEEKKPETGRTGNTSSSKTVAEKKEQQKEDKSSVVGGEAGVGGGGEGKKKKDESGSMGETSSIGPPQHIGGGPMPTTISSNQHIPPHQGYQYPLPRHNYQPPPGPVYTMSYNTAHPPVNSYTTSYYAPSPSPQSYAYSHFGSEMHPPPMQLNAYSHYGYRMAPPPSVASDYESYRQPSSVDSFEMFSDENANGCLVM